MPPTHFHPGGIFTVYQPIVELSSGKILGYEALTRGRGEWRMPQEMFRFSYEEGHTIALDFVCLKTAAQILPKLKKGRCLFLNVEPTTLSHTFMKGEEGDFFLRDIADYSDQIIFELTEGMKARDFELVKRGIRFIQKFGFRFAIDDVAGIDAKLIRLITLKPAFMKIDMSLVKGIHNNRLNQEIIGELIQLGKPKRTLLVAEGVESRAELNLVRNMGIHFAQGFYYAKPSKILRDKVFKI